MNGFITAFQNLKRNMTRTWLLFVIIAIVSCTLFAASLFLKSINNALRIGTYRLGADIVVVPADSEREAKAALLSGEPAQFYMDKSVLDQVKQVEGVKNAAPQLFIRKQTNVSCCYNMDVFLVAFDPDADFTIKPWIDNNLGRNLGNTEVITGRSVPASLGDTVPFYGTMFTIKGSMEATGMDFFDRAVFMNLETAYTMADESRSRAVLPLGITRDQISTVLVRTDAAIDPERVALRIEHEVDGVKALASDGIINIVRKQLTVLMKAISVMSNVLWIVVVLIIAFAYHTAGQGRGEGAWSGSEQSNAEMQRALPLLLEASMLSAAGGLVGIVLGYGILFSFRNMMLHYLQLPYLFPSLQELLALGASALVFSVLTGLIAAALPAFMAGKRESYEPVGRISEDA